MKSFNLKNSSEKFGSKLFIFFLICFFGFWQSSISQVVEIPREGFPYCQPFTGSGPFENTILGGEIRIPVGVDENQTSSPIVLPYSAQPNGESLQLTPNLKWHSGYAIVDIPFSSQFGIKTSFEYFSYGGTGADGISFFMFDADIPLDIGWLGGSLAYAPLIDLSNGSVLEDGIDGGYLGIGFDEFGNFAVGSVNNETDYKRVQNNITVRGPQSDNYQVKERYLTTKGSAFGVDYFPPNPDQTTWFPIDHNELTRQTNCELPGYRKVYIELIPSGVGYQIKIDMLVNTLTNGKQLVSFPLVNYSLFAAPTRLKIGFAGATGGSTNFHEIRNVTVNVSDNANINEPQIPNPNEILCVNDGDLEMDFKVQLGTSDAFITCLQLFNTNPGSPDNSISPTDFNFCGLDGSLCKSKCDPDNYEIPAYDANGNFAGTFFSELQNLNTGNFNQLRELVNVRFKPAPGFVGKASVYYNVTDNYGLTSEPGIITITSHPYPVINPAVTVVNPTCDGQEDGNLSGLSVSSLVAGFDYEWSYNGTSIGKAGAMGTYNSTSKTAVFALEGLNLGTYTLNVWNPSTSGGCYETHDVIINQESGTPVELDAGNKVICEGEEVSFLPSIDNLYNPSGAAPQFSWYLNANRAGGALVSASTITLDGNPVQVAIKPNGEITLSGLKYTGPLATKSYTFFVEAKDQSTPTGNFCPFIGNVLFAATVEIYPPLNFSVTHLEDWCLGNIGSVTALVTGVTGPVSYTLQDQSGNAIATNGTGSFPNLSVGDYSVFASTTFCNTAVVDITVDGPTQPLVISPIASVNSYCALPNGSLEFSIQGGISPYKSIILDGNPVIFQASGFYKIDGLLAKNYILEVIDREGCTQMISMNLQGDPPSEFSVLGMDVCEGQAATVVINLNKPSTSTPVFNWYSRNPAGDYVLITNGLQVGEITYTIDANFELTIDGLKANPDPYLFFLNVTGNKVCDQGYIPAEIRVNPGPEMKDPLLTQIECFGANTGIIQAQIPSGNLADFTFSLTGDNGINLPLAANKGLFENLTSGVYELTIRRADGCTSTISGILLTEPTQIISNLSNSTNPTCSLSNGEVSFEITGGTGKYTILINGLAISTYSFTQSGNTYLLEDLAPGVYSIKVSDESGCVVDFINFFTLVNDPGIRVDLEPLKDENCEGGSIVLAPVFTTSKPVTPIFKWFEDQSLTVPIQNTTNPVPGSLSYQFGSDGTLTVSGLDVGDYTYYVEISGPGICTFSSKAEVTVYPPIGADISQTNETCFGAADGSISIVPKGGNGIFEYSLNNLPYSTNTSFANLSSGKYELKVRNGIGCEAKYDIEIEGPAAPITINLPDLLRASCDLENGSIENLQIAGGWANYQVEWRKGSQTGQVIPGTANGAANLGPDTYYMLIADLEGCSEVFSFVIEESSDPVYKLVDPINVCFGEPITIRPVHIAPNPSLPPTAFTEVKWFTEAGQVGQIANGPDPQNPSITYTIDDIDWLNPQLLVENLSAGTHDFYFYVECTGQEIKVELTVYETPRVVFEITPVTCFGDTNGKILMESGTLPEYRYSLNGAAPISQAAIEGLNLKTGTYTIEVTAPAGCPQIETIVIESPSALLAISGITQVDPGCGASNGRLDALISGGWLPYTVTLTKNGSVINSLSSADGILSFTGLVTGVYQFEITDAEGCKIVSAKAELIDGPTQILIDDLEICSGEIAVFTPVLDPAAAGASYNWTFDAAGTNPIVPGSTVAGVTYQIGAGGVLTVSGLSSSNLAYTYYLTASGGGVCTGFVGNADVRVFDSPKATFTVENEICFSEGGQIQINATGGSGIYTYSLNGQPAQSANLFQVPVGIYSVLINTPQGCFVELTNIQVTGPPEPLNVSNLSQENPTCELANGTITFTVTGGYGNYNVKVIKDGVSNQTVQADSNGVVKVTGIGSGVYQFEISDSEGCIYNMGEPLDLVEVPTEITANNQDICEGESAQLVPSVPSNIQSPVFSWYFDQNESQPVQSGSNNGVTYSINSTGHLNISGLASREAPYTYYVMAAGVGICGVEPKSVKVYVSSIPILRVSNPSIVCDPEGTVDLTNFIEGFNSALYDYDVLNPNGTELRLDQLEAVDLTGDYKVSSSIKNANCWNEPQRIRVIISDSLLVANFQYTSDLGDGIIGTNDKIQIFERVQFEDLTIGRAIIWNWDFGDGATSSSQNPIHIFTEKGTFIVTLSTIDQFGCLSEFVMQVEVTDEYKVMVPNAFTPNGQKNQYFRPVHRGIAAIEFYVFNTWGELIFNSNELEGIGWDGTLKSQNVPNGNYVYKVKYQTRSGENFELTGVFILIR